MGILNVTPDSFSDGGKYPSSEAAVRRGLEMAGEGAGIIDVGGESTRPGSFPVPAGEEIARVAPVIRELARKTEALVSVDTTKSAVARAAIDAGAQIVNDTSALEDDPEMAGVVREFGCAVVLMHRRGTPSTMQRSPHYDSLFDEMLDELRERMAAAEGAGIPGERILVDPGVGFGKRFEDNLALHRHLPDLRNLGRPLVFGPSRKAFLGRITGKEAPGRIFGTAASVAFAASLGAHILRVHDVKEMKEIVQVVSAVREGAEC
jgi:dihydropteroate synthase